MKKTNLNEKKQVLLMILDGFAHSKNKKGNAIAAAKTPNFDNLWNKYPHTYASGSGEQVGLPEGQMGNSEVGHLNIGAGRVVYQSLSLINKEIREKKFAKNKIINEAIKNAKKNKTSLHLMGLLSDGGVHSYNKHLYELIRVAKENNIDDSTYIHIFTDGRDVAPDSGINFVKELNKEIKNTKVKIASISGRYYSMDRDQRWEREQKAYDVMVNGKGQTFSDIEKYIENQYQEKITDEFIVPAYNEKVKQFIGDSDSIIFYNFRPDRAREISHLLIGSKAFDYKPEGKEIKNLYYATMRPYLDIKSQVIYPNDELKNTLGEVIYNNGLSQIRAAETEKYPHVTFFIDGGINEFNFKTEKKILINSPKVATYDLKPEMSIYEVTKAVIKEMNNYDLTILNFANPDMVGHTGDFNAVVKAVEAVDECIGKIYQNFVEKNNGIMFITADHGNAEEMIDSKGKPITKHTTNPVPVIITDKNIELKKEYTSLEKPVAKLGDYAPTILKILGVKIPKEMTGKVLIK